MGKQYGEATAEAAESYEAHEALAKEALASAIDSSPAQRDEGRPVRQKVSRVSLVMPGVAAPSLAALGNPRALSLDSGVVNSEGEQCAPEITRRQTVTELGGAVERESRAKEILHHNEAARDVVGGTGEGTAIAHLRCVLLGHIEQRAQVLAGSGLYTAPERSWNTIPDPNPHTLRCSVQESLEREKAAVHLQRVHRGNQGRKHGKQGHRHHGKHGRGHGHRKRRKSSHADAREASDYMAQAAAFLSHEEASKEEDFEAPRPVPCLVLWP